tara:strand:- start:84 stop:467 length:384 start_codon:yes stop_codon:yes gene_type:complete
MDDVKISSNRNFGIVFFVVFILIGLYPLINQNEIKTWAILISLIFLVLGLLNSKILNPLNKIWFEFGILLGKVISPLIMGVIFFLVVTPTGMLMRLLNKDLLKLKFNNKSTYWVEKKGPKSKMKNQF